MASVCHGEVSELPPPRSEQRLSSGVNEMDADSSVATDAGTDACADALQLLLTQASPRCSDYIDSWRMDDSGVEHAAPALDVAFPVMHAYNLQLTDTIAVQLGEVDGGRQECRDLLRPSVRLLCSIGRSLVVEQYRRQVPERIRLRGVKAPKMSEEARREEREYLHQTLPPTGVAVASLRWRAKDLGGVPGEESGSECVIPVARKEARVFVQSLPSNVPTVEVEGASALPSTSSTVSGESCQPTRKVVIIGKRVMEGGDKVCCEEAAADEGGQSWRRWLLSGNAEEVPAKRLRCESATGVEVVGPPPRPSLLPQAAPTPPSALPVVRTADSPTGGMHARGAVPAAALSTSCLPKPRTEATFPSHSVMQEPRRPCSFVFHHSVVNAASGQEGGAVLAESHNGSVKGIATTDGGRNDCVAERLADIVKSSGKPQSLTGPSMVPGNPYTAFASQETEACEPSAFSSRDAKYVHLERESGDVVMMCPMCSFSSCDREAIMRHVIDTH
ncbi:hypothetical protein EGR_03328 [Echinococcus granulosus]|uniref:Uncharacterized protein n=1 Tax=Echinococcus granulosus TaxID=6210 RepID=W6UTT1_ECHGR|nr:hypothetical protein EGR_03328 [Echinococcus granulosus]EUB61782.1 hypothetical protein EGR_03328 [Echinococcus granulosus]